MSYIGSTPTTQSFISGTDYFNGTGSQTAFTLSRNVASVNDVEAVVNNVVQRPNDAYTISGTTITFTSAPSAGTQNIYVRYLSTTTQSITPSQNTVSYATWDNDLRNETFAFKNRIINGAMMIDQRNAGASVTPTVTAYTIDRFQNFVLSSATGRYSVQRSTVAPSGFTNSMLLTVTTTNASPSATFGYGVAQAIEGFNIADLGWGTANAQTVTLSFWVRSSVTGAYCLNLTNNTAALQYTTTYTINAANTWEQKTVTIVGPTSGTWESTNSSGVLVVFGLGGGSDRTTASLNSWNVTGGLTRTAVTGAINLLATSGATFQITGVQFEKGSTATSFDYRPYGTELALCQRYFESIYFKYSAWSNGTNNVIGTVPIKVTKRTAPTTVIGSDPEGWTNNFSASTDTYNNDSLAITATAAAGFTRFGAILSISAEL